MLAKILKNILSLQDFFEELLRLKDSETQRFRELYDFAAL
jgi:hypothetical protein